MRTVALAEVTVPVKTWVPSREPACMFDYIDLSAVDSSSKEIRGATRTLGSEAPSRARQLAKVGDVLVSTVRPNLNAVAMIPAELNGATVSTGFTVLRPIADLDGRFLIHWVRSPAFVADMVRQATGASYPAVSDRIVKSSRIPALPLGEQQRIAAILDQADAVRAKRRQVLAHLDTLTQSIFHEMFSEMAGPTTPLGAFAEVKGGKRLPKGSDYSEGPTRFPYIRVTDLRDGTIKADGLCYLREDTQRQIARYIVQEDDVIISIAGSLGVTARVPPELAGANLTENAARITAKYPGKYRGTWLSAALQTRALQAQIAGRVGQATIGKLALFRIEQLELQIPPLHMQAEYVRRCEQIRKARTRVRRALAADDELFASLQSRAFRGAL